MRVNGHSYRSIWCESDGRVCIIDQTLLPHEFRVIELADCAAAERAIRDMQVRGAPLIGATAAYGIALAMRAASSDEALADAHELLLASRPTAVNLRWALQRMHSRLRALATEDREQAAFAEAAAICDEDVAINASIGGHGLAILRELQAKKSPGETLRVLTHCNAGWIATVDWGTALATMYRAHDAGLPLKVWVDETRPRLQGAALTAWELGSHGVEHELITDNAGGLLMRRGEVDVCIVGTDRVAANGDVCNKIGTYLKALAAKANGVPFYVALPSPTVDWDCAAGDLIPIEARDEDEVRCISGIDAHGERHTVRVCPEATRAHNPGFDITPAELVTGLITEHGVFAASPQGLAELRVRIDELSEVANG